MRQVGLAKTLVNWDEPYRLHVALQQNQRHHRRLPQEMKLIQRRAYGFKSFENYRLRVIAECG